MSEIIGYEGAVYYGAILPGVSDCAFHANAWSLDVSVDLHEVTDFCTTGFKEQISGLKEWTGSIELRVDDTARVMPSDIGETAMLRLYTNATNYLEGLAIFTGWGVNVSVDDVETQTVEFTGTSDLWSKTQ